ncbi:hypothetical protein COV18_06945 [Candidatus Woesearchaeota archaeon CG10_big_fil_rev_8_21_14_0_10_37_12]|nr:MAG: hypothetical protein COV18_06945 [Candidatus Woesearchaeota archaeon CG10_big_fil_rev_8_21_14_0_10_37_12]
MAETSIEERIETALTAPYASVIRGNAREWSSTNSTTLSTNKFNLTRVIERALPDAPSIDVNVNCIVVNGSLDKGEEPHYHDSYVIGIIQRGHGRFTVKRDGKVIDEQVSRGDIVIIPKGTYHVFDGTDILYAAFEFGKEGEVNYQRHQH